MMLARSVSFRRPEKPIFVPGAYFFGLVPLYISIKSPTYVQDEKTCVLNDYVDFIFFRNNLQLQIII